MCGISGFIDFKKQTSNETLEKMNRIMAHRGPDGEGYLFFDALKASVGLYYFAFNQEASSDGKIRPDALN